MPRFVAVGSGRPLAFVGTDVREVVDMDGVAEARRRGRTRKGVAAFPVLPSTLFATLLSPATSWSCPYEVAATMLMEAG